MSTRTIYMAYNNMLTTLMFCLLLKYSTTKSFQFGDVFGSENDGSDDGTTLIDREVIFYEYSCKKFMLCFYRLAENHKVLAYIFFDKKKRKLNY